MNETNEKQPNNSNDDNISERTKNDNKENTRNKYNENYLNKIKWWMCAPVKDKSNLLAILNKMRGIEKIV